ncbi:MAG: NAD-dependent epimerase/dehydratase family protein [Tannerellaceae bacterium]|jgi:UDP-glucose 4-epimerase|nr:NAD-dependent epimerase/dehydratase family protein [Tannerellaceae bacterium]
MLKNANEGGVFTSPQVSIFITGVAGFLGSHLADAMLKAGHKVAGCDNLLGGYLENVPDGVDFHQIDCGYLNTMNKLLRGVDIVYHTACTAYEGLSVFSPHLVCQNTFQITTTVASAAVSQGVKRFVNCSSMARYGTQETVPFTEDMTPKPQDPYGIAKFAAENLLNCLSDVHGMEVVHAVPHNIIGPRQKYDDPYRNVASIMINLMLQGRQPIIYGDGEQKRCFSFVQDVIECLAQLAFLPGIAGEIINIGPDEEFCHHQPTGRHNSGFARFRSASGLCGRSSARSPVGHLLCREGAQDAGI